MTTSRVRASAGKRIGSVGWSPVEGSTIAAPWSAGSRMACRASTGRQRQPEVARLVDPPCRRVQAGVGQLAGEVLLAELRGDLRAHLLTGGERYGEIEGPDRH